MKTFLLFRKGDFLGASLLKKGFGHIDIIRKTELGFYCWLRPYLNWIDCDFLLEEELQDVVDLYDHVLVIESRKEIRKTIWFILAQFSCVTYAKHSIGLKCFAITPYQLYKKLLKRKYKNIVDVEEIK